jgi:hypothetical protein
MKYIIILVSILSLTSCFTKRQAIDKFCKPETRIKDSIVIKDSLVIKEETKWVTKTKDSTIYTKAVKDSGEVDVKENGTYKFNNGVVQVQILIKDGKAKWKVNVSSTESRYVYTIDSMASVISTFQLKDSLSIKEKETIKIIDNTKELKWYDKIWLSVKDFFSWIGLILTLFLILRFAFIRLVGSLSS